MRFSSHGVRCYCLNQGWGSLWFSSQKQFFYFIPSLVEMVLRTRDQHTVLSSCWCQATTLNWPCSHPVPSGWSASSTCAAREWTRGAALPMRWTERLGLHACQPKQNGLFSPPILQSEEGGFKAWSTEWLPFDRKRKRARRCSGQFETVSKHWSTKMP